MLTERPWYLLLFARAVERHFFSVTFGIASHFWCCKGSLVRYCFVLSIMDLSASVRVHIFTPRRYWGSVKIKLKTLLVDTSPVLLFRACIIGGEKRAESLCRLGERRTWTTAHAPVQAGEMSLLVLLLARLWDSPLSLSLCHMYPSRWWTRS